MSPPRSRAWLWSLVAAAVLTQGAIAVIRPITTYKLITLGAGATVTGLVTAAYAVLPLFVALWVGRLTDRTPQLRGLTVAGAVTIAAGGALIAAAPSLAVVTLGSVALGLGHLLFTISGQAAIARYSRDADLDLGFGWFTAAYSVGQTLGPLLGGAIVGMEAVTASVERAADIDRALWIGAALSLLASPFLLLGRGAEAGRRARGRRDGGRRPSPAAASASPGDGRRATPERASLPGILRRPGVASNMLASMAMLAMIDILAAFLPLVGEKAGVAPAYVGLLLAARGAASILSRALLPWISYRWPRERLMMVSLAISGVTLAIPPLIMQHLALAAALLAVGGFFLGIGQPLTMTLITTAVPISWRSQALAVRLMGNRVGQVGFPLAAGLLAAPFGPGGAIWLTCAVLLGAAAGRALLR